MTSISKPKSKLPALIAKAKNRELGRQELTGSKYRVSSLIKVYERSTGLAEHYALQSIDLNEYESLDALVLHLFLNGSQMQRAGLIEVLGEDSGISGVPLYKWCDGSRERIEKVITLISNEIESLANDFGVNVAGDPRGIAQTIFQNNIGLTFTDMIIFFHHCRNMKYKTETQHISTRGINREFLLTWVDAYVIEREGYILDVMKSEKQANDSGVDISPATIKEKTRAIDSIQDDKRRRARWGWLESKAKEMRQSTMDVVENEVDGSKYYGLKQNERRRFIDNIYCHIVKVYNPEFSTHDANEWTSEIASGFVRHWREQAREYDARTDDSVKEFIEYRARKYSAELERVVKMNTFDILKYTHTMSMDKGRPFSVELAGGDKQNWATALGHWHGKWAAMTLPKYYEYLDLCVSSESIPVTKSEFMCIDLRKRILEVADKSNDVLFPFSSIENYEQNKVN